VSPPAPAAFQVVLITPVYGFAEVLSRAQVVERRARHRGRRPHDRHLLVDGTRRAYDRHRVRVLTVQTGVPLVSVQVKLWRLASLLGPLYHSVGTGHVGERWRPFCVFASSCVWIGDDETRCVEPITRRGAQHVECQRARGRAVYVMEKSCGTRGPLPHLRYAVLPGKPAHEYLSAKEHMPPVGVLWGGRSTIVAFHDVAHAVFWC